MAPRALVVDNDFFFVEFLSELLSGRGYEVVKAYDGKEAIESLQGDSFNIVFLDILMPKIDGSKVIKYVRARFPQADFPIVALSGTMIERVGDLDDIGADVYIAKGPMEKMEAQISGFLEEFEHTGYEMGGQGAGGRFFEPVNLYPRQETAELIDAVEFQKGVMESLAVGVLVIDRDGRLIYANAVALRIMDLGIEDLLNRPVLSLVAEEDRAGLASVLKSLTAGTAPGSVRVSTMAGGIPVSMKPGLLKVGGETAGWVVVVEVGVDG